jgi:dimethylargininase
MIAFARQVSPQFGSVEVGNPARKPINVSRAQKQHETLMGILTELGATSVEYFAGLPQCAHGVFVGDTAVLLPEIAIIARPGLMDRIGEIDSVLATLGQHRPVQSILDPGTLNAGDVLGVGRTLYVAESQSTNADGVAQLRDIVAAHGYDLVAVPIRESGSLRSACSFVPPHFVVLNPTWADVGAFRNLISIPVHEKETLAANTITVGRTTLVSASARQTEKRLSEAGVKTKHVDISEFEKANGGLSSLCLLLEPRSAHRNSVQVGVKPVRATGVPASAGHSSQAVVHGGLVYTSPLLPFDPGAAGGRYVSVEEQTEQAIRNLSLVLSASGSSLGRVLRSTIHVSDPRHTQKVDIVCARMFGGHRPARSVVANAALPHGVHVQIEAVAALGDEAS